MENEFFDPIKQTVKYWYLPLILGILFILSGLWIFMTPVGSYLTLSVLFALTFLFAGLLEVIYAISNRKHINTWGWTLVSGILGIVFGILLLTQPLFSVITLGFFVGFGVLFYAIIALGRSIELQKYKVEDWGLSMFFSIIGIIFGFLMIWNPLFGGLTIVIYTAIAFITLGIFQIYLSNRLRKISKRIQSQ